MRKIRLRRKRREGFSAVCSVERRRRRFEGGGGGDMVTSLLVAIKSKVGRRQRGG